MREGSRGAPRVGIGRKARPAQRPDIRVEAYAPRTWENYGSMQ